MRKPLLFLLLFILSLKLLSQQQPNLSGYISIQYLTGTTYQASITNYSIGNPKSPGICSSQNTPDTMRLYYGDGTSQLMYRTNGKIYPPDTIPSGDSICPCQEVSIYSGKPHTFPGNGVYNMWYTMPGLLPVNNLPGTGSNTIYIYNTFKIDPFAGDTIYSPIINAPVCAYACMDECYYFNFSGSLVTGDSISYSTSGREISPGYFVPPGLVIDGATGTVSWCNPTFPGSCAIAIYITTYVPIKVSGQPTRQIPVDTMETLLYLNISSTCPTGINELSTKEGYIIYPNPSNDIVHINGTTEGNKTVTLYNVLGQAVLTKESNKKQIELNMLKLSEGVYFVNIMEQATGKRYTLKLMKD